MDDIKKEKYEPELTLLDKYNGFAGELLRISLLGIALLGFFIDKVVSQDHFTEDSKRGMLIILGVAAVVFALAAAAALAHRYYSTDQMFYLVKILRLTPAGQQPALPTTVDPSAPKPELAQALVPPDRLRRLLNQWFYGGQIPINDDPNMLASSGQFANWFLGLCASLAALAACILVANFAVVAAGFRPPPPKPATCTPAKVATDIPSPGQAKDNPRAPAAQKAMDNPEAPAAQKAPGKP
jgi:hypothetical protein